MTVVEDRVAATTSGEDRRLFLAEGTELLGEFQNSAYRTPKYLVRRADGQVMQLPELLYRLAGSMDGRRAGEIAAELNAGSTGESTDELTAEQVCFLVDERLRPVGIVEAGPDSGPADAGGAEPAPPPVKSDPLLALRHRVGLVPAEVSWRVAGVFGPLFARPVWVLAIAAFVAVHGWITIRGDLLMQGLAGIDQLAKAPALLLAVYVVQALSATWHECGHVTACRYGGARPGDMGVGLYIVWPAFYSTVTDSYRLDRTGRLRTDLGGIYFDAIFLTGVGVAYLHTGQPWLLIALFAMLFETAWQFLPSIRLDGYYILADLVGVPDLFGYLGPALRSLLPGRPVDPRMQELRPGARRVVITWVALAVPTLLAFAAVFLLAMPHVLPVVWDALLGHLTALDSAVRAGNATATTVGVVEVALLILPWLGLVLVWGMLWGALRSAAARRWGWAWLQPAVWVQVRRVAVLLVAAAVAVLVVWRTWFVALTAPAGEAETRIVNSAWTVLERGRGAAPAVPFPEAVVREQLLTYAQLTGAFERHADVVSAGRELAVASVVVLVGCLVATAVMLRWRTWVVIVPLAAVAAMGPAVGTLAAVGPGLVGAAWTAVGGTLVLAARHRHGRHRRSAGVVLHRLAVGLGIAAVAVGLATAPVLAVPLAVAAVLLVARPGAWALRPRVWTALVLSGSCLIAMAGAMSTVLFRVPAAAPLSAGEVQVLLVLAGLVVVAGALSRGSGVLAATTGALVVVALVPSPGSDAVLPLLVCATAALGALVLARWVQDRAEQGPSRQIRAALAVPVVLVVVVAALFVPERALDRPDRALPQQVGGAGTGAGVPADLGSRNGPGPVAGSEVRAVVAQMAGAASTVDSSGTAGPRGEVRWAVVDGSPSSGAPSAGVSPDGTGPGVVPPADVAPSAGGFTGAPAGAAASGRTAPGPPALGGPASGGPARSCPVPDPPATDAAASGGEAPAGGVASGGRASAGGASSGPAPGHDGAPGEAGARGRTLPDVTTGGTITDLDPGRMTSHQGLGVKVPSVVDPE